MSENQIHQNAVSVYGQEGLDDFPVLKAFQQYIDAEQIKSRKRMVMLSIFFAVLLTIVIAIFLLVLKDVSAKNQALNDRLIELVSKERDRQPVVVQPPAPAPVQQSANDAALKAMTETLVTLQKQIAEQQQQAKRAPEPPPPAAVPEKPTREQMTIQQKIDSDTEKLKKAQELLKAEKQKMAAEKERLRQQEIEYHRRRLYPDYYEKLDREAAAEKREAERATREKAPAPRKPAAKPQPQPAQPKPAQPKPAVAPAKGAINYFDIYEDEDDMDDAPLSNKDLDDELLDSIAVPKDQPKIKKVIPPTQTPAAQPKSAQPKPEPPKAEPPKVEQPKPAAQPKAEPPKPVEQPKVEQVKPVEQPQAEQPKVEQAKPVEQPKAAEPSTPAAEQPKPETVQPAAAPEPVKKPAAEPPTKPAEQPVVATEPAAAEPEPVSISVEINGAESDWIIPTK